MVNNHKHISFARQFSFLILLLVFVVMLSCNKHTHDVKPEEKIFPEIHTGVATFHALGGVIETFNIHIEKMGNVPIEEYGVVYAFLPETTLVDLVVDGPYPAARFKEVAKQGSNTETFKIGFPSGTHALSYRAYVKLEGGEVRYADNSFNKTY
ncbi:hypothetical protein LZD49_25395 [Dyadobacter sp. CY261]|uniref:hypothetical protein n=1 Tax=Dyadobacter sp. CY261 TaxID=2907203 RepID=UPI001F31C50B|nr:hypothetical protein [Dyadobacter sp. CY261]MCF0073840.1 hypothetical protein [Dyadobacter sp. CY261]